SDGCGAGTVCAAVELPGAAAAAGSGGAGDGGADVRLDGGGGGSAGRDGGGDGNDDGSGSVANGGHGPAAPGAGDGGGTASAGGPTGFHGAVGLAACKLALDCPTGLACRELAGAGPDGTRWTHACFPRALGDVGDPCRDPDGTLAGAACVSGTCADLGALGVC